MDPFDVRTLSSSTIEVEFVMGEDQDSRPSQQMPPVKRPAVKPAVREAVPQTVDPVNDVVATTDATVSPDTQNETELSTASDVASSSTSNDGTAAAAGTSILSPEQKYLAEVRRILESKKNYPMAARRLGHQGRVIVRFVVGRDGHIIEAKITQGSASDILNRAARSLIENIGGLKPFPSEIRLAEWAVVVPIEYQM